jgi:esterase
MKLEFRKSGTGPSLVILHGLYGSGNNWFSIATELSRNFTVYLPDQRNHGNSPHNEEINYDVMTADLEVFFSDLNIEKAILIGHSMGGKVAMNFALKNPEKVEKLIVVDIALRSYSIEGHFAPQALIHRNIIDSLTLLDIKGTASRIEIDQKLSAQIKEPAIRQFLLKNLKRDESGYYFWGMNLEALKNNITRILDAIEFQNRFFTGPVLIISGKKSGYINENDVDDFKIAFPGMTLVEFDSGHWVHIEQTERFMECIKRFLF